MRQQFSESDRFTVKRRIWLFGTSAWIVGIIDRSIAIFSSGSFSAIHIIQLLLAVMFFVGWLYLKPTISSQIPSASRHSSSESDHELKLQTEYHLFEKSIKEGLASQEHTEDLVLSGKSEQHVASTGETNDR
jgi:hypothetical protein